ncbi:carboxymuconolactone decarboxylase family protein [Intrasporangium oryzae]|uniref:carboxymuconolactone decarboxylase family protein n=1 Tax=Intrasporangium oryzae TaxID=412687 RepID=UPI0004B43A1B|nr:carboxymuconolactone decarboxylase family protein [Intrasporangium oryzae]
MSTQDETPVLDVIGAMTAASLERSTLPPDSLLMVRIAALAAVDARPVSYLAHVGPAVESGVTIDTVQGILVAIAPIIGTARTMKAAANISDALGYAIAILAAEEE